MTPKTMWKKFNQEQPQETAYTSWSFGQDSDALADLVVQGIKTATASAYVWYEIEGESLPRVGDYSIICDSQNQARCIIQTTAVSVVPFDQVSEQHAAKEGEGDRTLKTWRKIHEAFFRAEFAAAKLRFHPQIAVVCEEFRVVYCPDQS